MPQLILVLLILIGGGYLVGSYFYNLAIKAPKERYREYDLYDFEKKRDWLQSVPSENCYLQSYDDTLLHAYAILNNPEKWVIIQHKYRSAGRNMSYVGKHYYDMGFSVLLVDARGHGESQGNYIGMGWHDRLDVMGWVDYLNDHYSCRSILLCGFSMGASTMIFAGGEELPTNVKGIIADSGYSSIKDTLKYQMNRLYHMPFFPILPLASFVTGRRAGYSLMKDGDGVKQMKNCKIPVLFIHTKDDKDVPVYMMEKLYDAGKAPRKKVIVGGSSHCMACWDEPEQYWGEVRTFCDKYINIE